MLSDGKVLGSDEVIIPGFTDGYVIETILETVYEITLGIDVGTELGSNSVLDSYDEQ